MDTVWAGAGRIGFARLGRGLFAGWMACAWLGLVLGSCGVFRAWPCLLAFAVVSLLVVRFCPPSPSPSSRDAVDRGRLHAWLAALSCATLLAALPPGEPILGGWDPGVYVHTAASLARSGSLQPRFADLAELPVEQRAVFGRVRRGVWEPFTGVRLREDGRLSPQFLHVYPSLMATFWPLGGVRAALWLNPLLSVGAVLALFALAAQFVGRRAALVAAACLAASPAQVWQSRFATSELLAQFLLLGGGALLVAAVDGRRRATRRLDGTLAGAAFGLALLTRVDSIFLVVPLALALLAGARGGPHASAWRGPLLAAAGLLSAHAWLHRLLLTPFYQPLSGWVTAGLAAAVLLALALLAVRSCPPGHRLRVRLARHRHAWRQILTAAFVAWCVFAAYVRPRLAVEGRVLTLCRALWPTCRPPPFFALLAGPDADNLPYLRMLFGLPGLVAAGLGCAVLLRRTRGAARRAWLAAALAAAVLNVTFLFHDRYLMFLARRYVPMALPLLALAAAAAARVMARRLARRRVPAGVVYLALVAVTVGAMLPATRALSRHRDWPGLVAWQARVAAHLPAEAVVYCDTPGFAAALRFIHGIQAWEPAVTEPRPVCEAVNLLAATVAAQAPLYCLTQSDEVHRAPPPGWECVAACPLASETLGVARDHVPRHVVARRAAFRLYRVTTSPFSTSARRTPSTMAATSSSGPTS